MYRETIYRGNSYDKRDKGLTPLLYQKLLQRFRKMHPKILKVKGINTYKHTAYRIAGAHGFRKPWLLQCR